MIGYKRDDAGLISGKGGNFLLAAMHKDVHGTAKPSGNVPVLKRPKHQAVQSLPCPLQTFTAWCLGKLYLYIFSLEETFEFVMERRDLFTRQIP
jgi:hypothetical protein